jgi:hypothetical protein
MRIFRPAPILPRVSLAALFRASPSCEIGPSRRAILDIEPGAACFGEVQFVVGVGD